MAPDPFLMIRCCYWLYAADNLLSRLQSAEFQIVQQRQQLATVVEQQGAIKEALVRLVESLEGQKVAANQATNAEVVELQQQVCCCT